jgi:D-alanyl-D-alanine carboxypeptidase (penicillin-binding protein 5/6)
VALFAALLLVTAHAGYARAAAPPQVTCRACIVVEADGTVVWARSAHAQWPNASTTKMVTALIVDKAADPGAVVTVSPGAASIGGGGLDLVAGDSYRLGDLMYAMLLSSSNEAAAALAEHVGGTQTVFVARMNRLVARLGAEDTHFMNPHGLDASGHFSSASDLALIGRALLDDRSLAKIVGSARATIATPRGAALVENRNPLLESYRGAVGIKTGQTAGAGNVLVAAARRNGRLLIAVAMGSVDAAADARILLDHGFAQPAPEPEPEAPAPESVVVAARSRVGALVFDPAGATSVITGEVLEAGAVGGYEVSFLPAPEILLPIAPGEMLGTVRVIDSTGVIASVPAVAESPVEIDDTPWLVRAIAALLAVGARIGEGVSP